MLPLEEPPGRVCTFEGPQWARIRTNIHCGGTPLMQALFRYIGTPYNGYQYITLLYRKIIYNPNIRKSIYNTITQETILEYMTQTLGKPYIPHCYIIKPYVHVVHAGGACPTMNISANTYPPSGCARPWARRCKPIPRPAVPTPRVVVARWYVRYMLAMIRAAKRQER